MPPLPERIELRITLDGASLAGAWVQMRLPMSRKNDYAFLCGPADTEGIIRLTQQDLAIKINAVQISGLMDYSGLEDWDGTISVEPLDSDGVRRAEVGYKTWGEAIPGAFAPDFMTQMASLLEHVKDAKPGQLRVEARTAPSVTVRCIAAPA